MNSGDDYKFSRLKGGWKIFSLKDTFKDNVLNQIENFIANSAPPQNWINIKSSANSKVWKFPADNRWYLFKEYLKRGYFDILKAAFTGSRGRKAWLNAIELNNKGFSTPIILVLGEKSYLGFSTRNFIVTEFLSDSYGVYNIAENRLNSYLTYEEITKKRSLIAGLGNFIGRLHSKGIFHGDLRPGNILITDSDNNPIFYFIDNERNRYFSRGIPAHLREKNLVQINMIIMPQLSFTDRLRFFNAYLNENPELKPAAKDWISKVFLKTRKRLQKKIPGLWSKD